MIREVEFKNFLSYKSEIFRFGKGATAFFGPIGSGKTSIVEGFRYAI